MLWYNSEWKCDFEFMVQWVKLKQASIFSWLFVFFYFGLPIIGWLKLRLGKSPSCCNPVSIPQGSAARFSFVSICSFGFISAAACFAAIQSFISRERVSMRCAKSLSQTCCARTLGCVLVPLASFLLQHAVSLLHLLKHGGSARLQVSYDTCPGTNQSDRFLYH